MSSISKLAVSSALVCCVISSHATADPVQNIIFNEDFARANNNSLGGGWFEIEESRNDVRLQAGAIRLRDNAEGGIDAGIARQFTASDLSGMSLSFDWKPLLASDAGDRFLVSWAESYSTRARDWSSLFSTSLGANDRAWTTSIIEPNQLAVLNGLDSFYLLFWTNLSSKAQGSEDNEGVWLDNITLTGLPTQNTPPAEVPLPSTLLLLASGLLCLVSRKKVTVTA